MVPNVDNFLLGHHAEHHDSHNVFYQQHITTSKHKWEGRMISSFTDVEDENTIQNDQHTCCIDMNSSNLFGTVSASFIDIVLSIIPKCFLHPRRTYNITEENTVINHHQSFDNFLHMCRHVGDRMIVIVVNILASNNVPRNNHKTFLHFVETSKECSSNDVLPYVEAMNREHDQYLKKFQYSSFSTDDEYAKQCIIKRFMVNVLKIGIMKDLSPLVNDPMLTDPKTWGMKSVEEFTINMKEIVDHGIKAEKTHNQMLRDLSSYYSISLFKLSQLIMPVNGQSNNNVEINNVNFDNTLDNTLNDYRCDIDNLKLKIPEKIQEKIKEFINNNRIVESCFALFDDLFLNTQKAYQTIKKQIKQHMYVIIFLLIWNIKLKGEIKTKFMSDSVIVNGISPTINTIYLDPINDMINNLNDYTSFMKIYEETSYPPVFLSATAVTRLNSLFKKVYEDDEDCIGLENFRKKITEIISQKIGYLADMIFDGFIIAGKRGIDVIDSLYKRCKVCPNHLILKDTYLIERCPMNPTSPFFLQVLNETQFTQYYAITGAKGVGTVRKKRYTSYVDNLHNLMMAHVSEPKDLYTHIVINHYVQSVTNPIDMKLFRNYVRKYYNFVKRTYRKNYV